MNKETEYPKFYKNTETVMFNFLTGARITAKVIGDITELKDEYQLCCECEEGSMYKKTHLRVPKPAIATIEIAYKADRNKDYKASVGTMPAIPFPMQDKKPN